MTDAENHGEQTILHVDMDAFYAAIEQLDQPELRGKPVVVGAPPDRRGVVATASYEARAYGIHSAMPSRTAFQRCPQAVFVPPRRDRYVQVSGRIMEIFREITPLVEPVSIDEAFLDVRSVLARGGNAVALGRRIKARIREELQLTASVGVASNKFLAKLASDLRKPDGLTVVPEGREAILRFLAPLPVTKIWGVGEKTAERLRRRGIRTIEQLQNRTVQDLTRMLGTSFGSRIWRLARGEDDRRVQPEPVEEKSISHEETFETDVGDPAQVRQTLIELTEKVGRRLRRAGRVATVAQIKVRFPDFRTISRQKKLERPTDSDRALLACAADLFASLKTSRRIRLIGFGVEGLERADDSPAERQLLLFPRGGEEENGTRNQALDQVVDELRATYGPNILKRGRW